jgi:hypothetical protein
MHEALEQARIEQVSQFQQRAADLTEMLQAIRSQLLMLAGALPTEAPYDPDENRYPVIQREAQNAVERLVRAWTELETVLALTERAARHIETLKVAYFKTLEPLVATPDTHEDDDIPY